MSAALYANPHVAYIPGNVQLFCIAGWISPLIPDSADIGAYSKSVQSRIYKVPGAALRCRWGDGLSFEQSWPSQPSPFDPILVARRCQRSRCRASC